MSVLTLLPLDLTGKKLSNRIDGEQHTLIQVSGKPHRLVVPYHGGFYSDHLVVFDDNGVVLTKDKDYKVTYLYPELTELTGLAVYGMIVVINPAVTARVKLNYRAVGSHFGISTEELADVLEQLKTENLPFPWDAISNKPKEHPSDEHLHEFWQIYGFENMLGAMEYVRKSILQGRDAAYQHDVDYAEAYRRMAQERLEQWEAAMDAHKDRRDNPHGTTKTQVGLAQLANYGMADEQQAILGTAGNVYSSPASTWAAISNNALPQLLDHTQDRTVPHGETADDIGAYTTGQFNNLMANKVKKTDWIENADMIAGWTSTDIYNHTRKDLSTTNFTGLLPRSRMGTGTADARKVLRGDGVWVDGPDWFLDFVPQGGETIFLGEMTRAAALATLTDSYFDLEQYPAGSVALYTRRDVTSHYNGNGETIFDTRQLDVLVRLAWAWA